jgi:hypothetical protein
MDSAKFREPSFIAASMACIASSVSFLLFLIILIIRPESQPIPDPRASELRQLKAEVGDLQSLVTRLGEEMKPMQTVASAEMEAKKGRQVEFNEALSKATEHLTMKEFAESHDYLLVASRISDTDRRLFNAVVEFIGKAKDSQDDEIVALAEDLLDRANLLVHFQSPKDVESSRKCLADLRAAFPVPPTKPQPESRSEPISRLIELANDNNRPIELRTMAVERARNALDEAWIDSSPSPRETGDDLTPDKIELLRKKAEEAEKGCVAKLFESSQAGIAKWLEETGKLIDEKNNTSQRTPAFMGDIDKAISRGIDLLQEVTPYAKSGVKGAPELSLKIEQRVGSLQRWKTWLSNREALEKIRAADTKDTAAETGLISMAKIDESLLAPYVAERYAEVWKKLFDSLSEDKKVEMTKQRVLRSIQ